MTQTEDLTETEIDELLAELNIRVPKVRLRKKGRDNRYILDEDYEDTILGY